MTQPDPMMLVTWQFNVYNDGNVVEEQAQIGVWGQYTPISDPTALQTALQDLADEAVAAWTTHMPTARFGNQLELKEVKVVKQTTAGATEREAVSVPSGTPWRGSVGTGSLPWENAFVIGLYGYPRGTFKPQARRWRGRVYIPGLAKDALGGTKSGLLASDYVAAVLGGFKDVLSQLLALELDGGSTVWHPSIFSRVGAMINQVVQLSADNKVDVHRSRERQQAASISNVDFP